MKRRVVTVILALLLTLSFVPLKTQAAVSKDQKIKDQIVTVYYRSLRRAGKRSFLGFCASAVNNQIYHLGIEKTYRGCNAKDLFNRYQRGGVTSGGYPVRPYPATQYTLESALNEITAGGTRDVYNILVGFQRSHTSDAGYRYGHAVMIHAILDSTVYFAECCSVMVDGRYYPEGSAIACSLDAFCRHYNSFAVLDGVAWFGNNTYVEQCTGLNVSLEGMSLMNCQLLTDIPGPEEYVQPETVGMVSAGSILKISRLYTTPEGEGWYEVQCEDGFGFIPASVVKTFPAAQSEIRVGADNVHMPTYLRKGWWFHLGGYLLAGDGQFGKVQIQIHDRYAAEDEAPLYSGELQVDGKYVPLSQVAAAGIPWHNLALGDYRLTILAQVQYEVWTGEDFGTVMRNRELWRSEFRVVPKNQKLPEVTFDACGGNAELERTFTETGEALKRLPEAKREGYTFLGWFTEPEGGQQITAGTAITGKVTYYAHWAVGSEDHTGWLKVEDDWVYYRKGKPVSGWFYYNGKQFRQNPDGTKPAGWELVDGKWYYFTQSGAVRTGWLETQYGTCYLKSDGTKAVGWITIQGKRCYFDTYGKLIRQL